MKKILTLPGLGEEVYKVAAIMFHPNDAAARRTFMESARVIMVRDLNKSGVISGSLPAYYPPEDVSVLHLDRLLDEAMPLAISPKKAKSDDRGGTGYTGTAVAAMILARALAEAEKGNDELGLAQIISDQGEEFRQHGVIGVGRDKLSEIWQEYRASAHISLACFEMGPGRRLREDPNALIEWVTRSS